MSLGVRNLDRALLRIPPSHVVIAQGPWLCAAAGGWTGLLTWGNDWKAELSGDY